MKFFKIYDSGKFDYKIFGKAIGRLLTYKAKLYIIEHINHDAVGNNQWQVTITIKEYNGICCMGEMYNLFPYNTIDSEFLGDFECIT